MVDLFSLIFWSRVWHNLGCRLLPVFFCRTVAVESDLSVTRYLYTTLILSNKNLSWVFWSSCSKRFFFLIFRSIRLIADNKHMVYLFGIEVWYPSEIWRKHLGFWKFSPISTPATNVYSPQWATMMRRQFDADFSQYELNSLCAQQCIFNSKLFFTEHVETVKLSDKRYSTVFGGPCFSPSNSSARGLNCLHLLGEKASKFQSKFWANWLRAWIAHY